MTKKSGKNISKKTLTKLNIVSEDVKEAVEHIDAKKRADLEELYKDGISEEDKLVKRIFMSQTWEDVKVL